jgi:aryl-alcohol dehydrogenase-like predicted oxidoreductase
MFMRRSGAVLKLKNLLSLLPYAMDKSFSTVVDPGRMFDLFPFPCDSFRQPRGKSSQTATSCPFRRDAPESACLIRTPAASSTTESVMEYAYLTGTGIKVSRFCLGTMTFGAQIDEARGIRAVDHALDQGVNFFDTANRYTDGKSEEILGKALDGKRDRVILATKAGNSAGGGINNRGCSRLHILQQVEISLKRLKTDYIDIYYLHLPDPHTPVEETLETLDGLVRSGKVRYLGSSNFAAWQACRLYYEARRANRNYPVVAQMVYNMITRGIEQEFIPFLKAFRLGLVVYNPIAAGLLTDKYAEKKQLQNTRFVNSSMYADRYWNDDNLAAWDAIHAIASDAGISMLALAMRWILTTGHVDSILTGFSSQEQLSENLKTLADGPLSPDIMAACDAVWQKLSGTRFRYNR